MFSDEGLLRRRGAVRSRREHGSRRRAAHRRRRRGLDARGASWHRPRFDRGLSWSDCSRICGLIRGAGLLRAIMESARGAPIAVQRPRGAKRVIGAAPRRSDRCAIVRSSSVQSSCGNDTGRGRSRCDGRPGRKRSLLVPDGPHDPCELIRDSHGGNVVPATLLRLQRPVLQPRRIRACLSRDRGPTGHRELAACGGSHRPAC